MVRTPLSYVIGIEVVQNSPLAILPRHTHSWSLMINVDELRISFVIGEHPQLEANQCTLQLLSSQYHPDYLY
jgi:hypothetical protein